MIHQSFTKKNFLGIMLYGPTGLCDHMMALNLLFGVRFLLYAVMDLPNGKHKLGLNSFAGFTEELKNKRNFKYHILKTEEDSHSRTKMILSPCGFTQRRSVIQEPMLLIK